MSENPFIKRRQRTANLTVSHKRSPKQEKSLALRLGGTRTPASGSLDVKGDVRVQGKVRIEAKTTKNKSFSVTLEMVRKIEEAALSSGEMPVIVVEFIDAEGRQIAELAVCPTYVLEELSGG